jgi:hypothetical protein
MSYLLLTSCACGSGRDRYPLYDGYGIFLTYCCDRCERKQLRKFRADIMQRYDADEPIDDE